jgi:hypothetical protein
MQHYLCILTFIFGHPNSNMDSNPWVNEWPWRNMSFREGKMAIQIQNWLQLQQPVSDLDGQIQTDYGYKNPVSDLDTIRIWTRLNTIQIWQKNLSKYFFRIWTTFDLGRNICMGWGRKTKQEHHCSYTPERLVPPKKGGKRPGPKDDAAWLNLRKM